jgi:hypothetical protein
METLFPTLFRNKPFPANAGPVEVVRLMQRTTPAYGPSKMPHKMKRPTPPARDALGRTLVEDGTGRLRAGWPPSYVGVSRMPFFADVLCSIMLWKTDKLNEFMKKRKMLAFCVISPHEVVMLKDVAFEKACAKLAQSAGQTIEEYDGTDTLVASLFPGPHRINKAQFLEIVGRLVASYREYGVGALVLHEDKFVYHVMVPNEQEYAKHQADYDARETALRASCDARHAGSKRTRSSAQYGAGRN